ncbi:MAG: GNAT family N-acetyltransferase [Patescibacteria group bacterium]|nr:GNAT family N-acetyltransferase [Patescibacteria group bacterium]
MGVRITLNYNKVIFDWYAASDKNYSNFYVNEILVWNTICWGIHNNYKIFDFGGAGLKGQYYGPAKFKEKFKGNLVEFGRYRFIPYKKTYSVLVNIYEKITKSKVS